MTGIFKNNKIKYSTPFINYLTGGNWENGFSRVQTDYPQDYEYDYVSEKNLIDGETYEFELKDNIAHIK